MRKRKYDFSKVDWSKTNKELQVLLGCSFSIVAKNRPLPQKRGRGRPARDLSKYSNVDWLKNTKDLAKELGISIPLVYSYRVKVTGKKLKELRNGNKSTGPTVEQDTKGLVETATGSEEAAAVLA